MTILLHIMFFSKKERDPQCMYQGWNQSALKFLNAWIIAVRAISLKCFVFLPHRMTHKADLNQYNRKSMLRETVYTRYQGSKIRNGTNYRHLKRIQSMCRDLNIDWMNGLAQFVNAALVMCANLKTLKMHSAITRWFYMPVCFYLLKINMCKWFIVLACMLSRMHVHLYLCT